MLTLVALPSVVTTQFQGDLGLLPRQLARAARSRCGGESPTRHPPRGPEPSPHGSHTRPRAPHAHGPHGAELRPRAVPTAVHGSPGSPSPAPWRPSRPRLEGHTRAPPPPALRILWRPPVLSGPSPGPVQRQPLPCPSGSRARGPQVSDVSSPFAPERALTLAGTSPPSLCSPPARVRTRRSGGSWGEHRQPPSGAQARVTGDTQGTRLCVLAAVAFDAERS